MTVKKLEFRLPSLGKPRVKKPDQKTWEKQMKKEHSDTHFYEEIRNVGWVVIAYGSSSGHRYGEFLREENK